MIVRLLLLSGVLLLASPATAGEPRLQYDLFESVTPIGTGAADVRPGRGETLLLQFWASWCHSCGGVMWDMDELVSGTAGLRYIAVSLDERPADARDYIRAHKLFEKYSDRYFVDADRRLSESLGIATVPTVLLVDAEGRVLIRKSGHLNSADLNELLAAARAMNPR